MGLPASSAGRLANPFMGVTGYGGVPEEDSPIGLDEDRPAASLAPMTEP